MTDTPWIRGNLTIPRTTLDAVYAHAQESYPSECCGFLFGPASDDDALTHGERSVNDADKYHALDPIQFPRTARTYFKINEIKAMKAMAAAQANGAPLKVIYHSHIDSSDAFSEEDAATFAVDNQLTWPCAFLVVSVYDGTPRSHRLWIHQPGTNAFVESPLVVL